MKFRSGRTWKERTTILVGLSSIFFFFPLRARHRLISSCFQVQKNANKRKSKEKGIEANSS